MEDIPPLHKGHLFIPCTPSHTSIQEKPMAQAISFSCIQFSRPQRSMSAAALSAAVDSTKLQGTAPNSQAEPTPQKQPTPTPAALRERGVWGERRFSQRSGLSPQNLPTISSSEGDPGEGLLVKKPPPPAHLTEYTLPSRPGGFSFRRPSFGTFRWYCPERRRKRSCFPQHRAG